MNMRQHQIFIIVLTLVFSAPSVIFASKPNIIIILADDMGYGDPRCYNSQSKIPTPNIDRIAAGGMRFTDAHTPSAVCTPTRYTLLTGRYCWRSRLKSSVLDGFSPPLIDPDQETIASFLKKRGYSTACIGKWHLGMQWTRKDGSPEDQDRWQQRGFRPGDNIDFSKPITGGPLTAGFDSFFGISASLDMPPYCWIDNDRCLPGPDMFVPTNRDTLFLNQAGGAQSSSFTLDGVLPELKKKAVRWLRDQHRADPNHPWFLYLPLNSPHLPVAPSKPFKGKSKVGLYGDFVMETDDLVGAVLDTIKETGDEKNTLLLFTSDNGGLWHQWKPQERDDLKFYKPTSRARYTMQYGHQSNAHLRGTKADIWEGGHRVPFLIQWPDQIKSGTVSDEPVELTDVFATIIDIAESDKPQDVAPDSYSFLSVIKSKKRDNPVRPFLIHHSLRGLFAIRQGDYKYIEKRGSGGFSVPRQIDPKPDEPSAQLYNLAKDPSETTNLVDQKKKMTKHLATLLDKAKASDRLTEK